MNIYDKIRLEDATWKLVTLIVHHYFDLIEEGIVEKYELAGLERQLEDLFRNIRETNSSDTWSTL